jgi:segregation and condensation protein B
MPTDETLKAVIEGILYVAPEPVTLDAMVKSLGGEERERVKVILQALVDDYERAEHGIQIRQIAGGYKFSTKPEHHEVLRKFVKSLKPPIRLSKPALETLAVIAYRQPVTLPEIDAIRGVDCGGVIHTLLEKKLVVTAGRKNVVGRPILYRTSRDFLVHFGLKDVSELPSLKEFEELARQALGSELTLMEMGASSEPTAAAEEQAAAETPPREAPAAEMLSVEAPAGESSEDAAPESATETDPAQS